MLLIDMIWMLICGRINQAAACFASAEHLADMIKAELKALKAT